MKTPINRFVGGTDYDDSVAYSPDGVTWTKIPLFYDMKYITPNSSFDSTRVTFTIYGIATNNRMWLMTGGGLGGYSPFAYSFDGVNWSYTPYDVVGFTGGYAIDYGNGIWVSGGVGTVSCIGYSTNGFDWAIGSTIPPSSISRIWAVVYRNGIWMAGGFGTSYSVSTIYYSSDGINWTASSQTILRYIRGIEFNGTTWVAVGTNSVDSTPNIIYSDNPAGPWTEASIGNIFGKNSSAIAVKWNGKQFLVVGETPTTNIASSTDGINWTISTPPQYKAGYSIAWTGTLWMIGQYNPPNGPLITSPDGINWSFVASANASNVFAVTSADASVKTLGVIVLVDTYPCFLEGTKILVFNSSTNQSEYKPIERLRKGDLVKTYSHGFVPIKLIGNSVLKNPKDDPKKDNRIYRFTVEKCPELDEDLFITGNHCLLYQRLSAKKREAVEAHMGKIYTTEGKYRVPALLDDRAEPYLEDGPATIWHFALEHNSIYDNYGVLANGLLVESSSIRYMSKLSNMNLID
jgi:hypothetical protein